MSSLTARGPRLRQHGAGAWLANLSAGGKAAVFAGEVLVVLVLWQLFIGVFRWINPVFVPPPLDIAQAMGTIFQTGTILEHIPVSLQAWFIGFAVAVLLGIPLGLLMGSSIPVDRILGPIAWTIYATPSVAYQPLAKAWFGFGIGPVIFLVAVSAIFPVMLNVAAGMHTTNASILHAGRVFGAGRMQLYRSIYLPSTVPFLFAGLRQGVVLATIGMVVAELSGSAIGMGAFIIKAANTYQTAQSFAAIILIMLFSVGMTQVVTRIERLVAPWTRRRGTR